MQMGKILLCKGCNSKLDWVLKKDKIDGVKCTCGYQMTPYTEKSASEIIDSC